MATKTNPAVTAKSLPKCKLTSGQKRSLKEKYGNSIKVLFPVRCTHKSNNNSILQNNNVGCLSFLSASWMNSTMWKAARKGLNLDDIGSIDAPDSALVNYQRLLHLWNADLAKYGPKSASLHRTLWRFNRIWLIAAGMMMALTNIFSYIGLSWLFEHILYFVGDAHKPLWQGILLVVGLSVSQLLKTICFSALWVIGATAGVRTYGALQILIYEKALNLKCGNEQFIAEIVNHSTSDIERIFQSVQQSMLIVGAPTMWILNVVYCYLLIGPWSLLGNLVILLYCPIMAMVASLTSTLRINVACITDKRIGLISQVLASIKLIKMYAWEETFAKCVEDVRYAEEKIHRKAVFLQSVGWTTSNVILMLASMSTIYGYVLCGSTLTSSQAFVLMSVYSALLFPLNTLPRGVKAFSEGKVCCQRIQKSILATDSNKPKNSDKDDVSHVIKIVNAYAAWDEMSKPNQPKTTKQQKKKLATADDDDRFSSKATLYGSNVTINNNNHEVNKNVQNGEMAQKSVLQHLNLWVKKGQLVAICGNIGSGKSTLLSTICGSTNIMNGNMCVKGSIALVTQQAWIFNGTARDNIIFGLPYVEQRYRHVVKACCLETDFNMMPHGDAAEIGEKGANLSGGQKQRISLARALYSDRDIYLLDDALSAVDAKVAQQIFQNGIQSILHDKTVLMVTHSVNILQLCDYIVVMDNGEITEQGTHQTLMNKGGQYALMVQNDKNQRSEGDNYSEMKITEAELHTEKPNEEQEKIPMIKEEVDLCNSITWRTWLHFCKMCGGYTVALLALFSVIVFDLAMMFNIIWLQIWMDSESGINSNESLILYSDNGNMTLYDEIYNYSADTLNSSDIIEQQIPDINDNYHGSIYQLDLERDLFLIIYGVSAFAIIAFGLLKAFALQKFMLKGATALHRTMFGKILRCPMYFFDTTPLGRIVNRFSKDMDELDSSIPYTLDFVLQSSIYMLFQFLLIGKLYPWYFLGLIIIFGLLISFDVYLNCGVCETKRVENLLRPPLLGHISTTLQGVDIIRCYEKKSMFSERFRTLVDKYLGGYLIFQMSSKWLAFRAELLSWAIITGTAFFVVFLRDEASAAMAGLAMVQIFRIGDHISVIMRWKSELSARLISIERVVDYCRMLPEEEPIVIESNRPLPEWPGQGAIAFQNVVLNYRPELPSALQNVNFNVKAGEKVGIIGRTGAGKSSVIGALLRLSEITEGTIMIDDVNISKIGLMDLRSKMAVIPQEPVLFDGTIRWNLDPFGKFNDEEIWEVLAKAHLKNKIANEPQQLETLLNAEGVLFSLGEKQLFCLARALLRKSKVLLLDEATASVDKETDQLIQATIRTAFSHCTVLTIAHRLKTIADYDKIMAMRAGKVIEFDTPSNLMATDSIFHSMMKLENY